MGQKLNRLGLALFPFLVVTFWEQFFANDLKLYSATAQLSSRINFSGTESLEVTVLYIPSDPDNVPSEKIHQAIQPPSNNSSAHVDPLRACPITSQVRLHIKNQWEGPWILQALDENGRDKTVGGDEFYITYNLLSDSDDDESPTAVALVEDLGNGTYKLDFVSSPMEDPHSGISYHSTKGKLTVHFVFTCGIGTLPPPTKDTWENGGYTQTSYFVAVPHAPPIRKFQPPPRPIDLSQFDHVLMVGDSVMLQFPAHNNQWFRPNISTSNNIGRPLNTETVEAFVGLADKFVQKVLSYYSSIQSLLLVLGSSTWDVLADELGLQGASFADHEMACRSVIRGIRNNLKEYQNKYNNNVTITVAWKSPTAVHAHVVVNRRTKWFGPVEKATRRIKYMSSSRSFTLYEKQKRIMEDELQVPFLDIYNASYLSADWHFPTDGRHYRPELNEVMLNWFYSQPPPNVTIDYSYTGYG